MKNQTHSGDGLSSHSLFGLERLRLSQTARSMDVFAHWKREGHLELSPPYQRGDVWGMIRRRNLIRSIMLGIPIPSIIINDRFSANWGNEIAVIDGKQRITTILMFLEGDLKVPSAWFGIEGEEITFPELPVARQRGMKNMPLPLCEGQLRSIEEEREVFELVNFGGVPQGESDSLPNVERMHHYQLGRAAIRGLRLKLRKVIESERLVGVVMERLVSILVLCGEPDTTKNRVFQFS